MVKLLFITCKRLIYILLTAIIRNRYGDKRNKIFNELYANGNMETQKDITDTPDKAFYKKYYSKYGGNVGTALDDDWYLYI